MKTKLDSEKVAKAGDEIERYTDYVNWFISPRMTWLSKHPFTFVWSAILIILPITMYPLALISLGVLPAALTVTILASD